MNIHCDTCGIDFIPSEQQTEKIKLSAEAGKTKLVITCPNCKSMVMAQPLFLIGLSDELPKKLDERLFCCPISACIGFVEEDKDEHVFGCSECGTEWGGLKSVYSDIERILKKYPYRKEVYINRNRIWESIPIDNIPKAYYDMVQKEE